MKNEIIMNEYTSGQKHVQLVKNEAYGKCIKITKSQSTETIRAEREVQIASQINSKYYPKIYYSNFDNNDVLIYEEYIEGCDLSEIFSNNNLYKNNEKLCLELLR